MRRKWKRRRVWKYADRVWLTREASVISGSDCTVGKKAKNLVTFDELFEEIESI